MARQGGSRAIVNLQGGRQGAERNGSTVTHHANAESTRSTVRGATSGLRPSAGTRLSDQLPKACIASGSLSGATQRRDRGATPQTGFSLGPQAAGSSLTPMQEPSPISPLPRSPLLSLAYGSASSSAGGPSNARDCPTLELGPPANAPLPLSFGAHPSTAPGTAASAPSLGNGGEQ